MAVNKHYWDTGCFIAMLSGDHESDGERAHICANILKHAMNDELQIWTSAWTIVETIRPKEKRTNGELPAWSKALTPTDKDGIPLYPNAINELQKLIDYYTKHTAPTHNLPEEKVEKIKGMFAWPYLKIVQVVPTIAHDAAAIARKYNLKPGDSLHVASAIAAKCDVLEHWDKDFSRIDSLIPARNPRRLSPDNMSLPLKPGEDGGGFQLSS